jgi:LuxR family maltose regulon positive regulatory protein
MTDETADGSPPGSGRPSGGVRVRLEPAIAVKLRPLSMNPSQVVRRAIVELVCAPRAARLVLIRAPAGFGKTTTMLQCRDRLHDAGTRTAWLTLDRSDNDASRFLGCLAAVLSSLLPDGAASHGHDGTLPAIMAALAALAAAQRPFALFIDELEQIRDPGIVGLLRDLIAGLPDEGRIVMGTRSVPDLSLGRLRARGHLLEVDTELLRFSQDETDEYLVQRRGITLEPGDRLLLQRKTEGWAAGLWLASAALARHASAGDFIARFSGTNVAVAEYLADDVLDLQSPAVRAFLVRTSILRELDPSLCQALVPTLDCAALLMRLEAENVLVTPIEGETRTWRYHGLFADVLRTKLAREAPDDVPALHAAAARWYEEHGRPVPAIDHALDGGDFDHALRLLETHAMALLAAGRMRLLSRWLEAIPAEPVAAHARLSVVRWWSVGLTRGPWLALAEMERGDLAGSSDPAVQAHLMALRPLMLALDDKLDEAYRLGMGYLDKLPTGDTIVDSALPTTLANLCVMRGRLDEALGLLDLRRRTLGRQSMGMGDMHAACILGTVALSEGRLAEAALHFRTAVQATPASSRAYTKGNVWAAILLAVVEYESGEPEDVRRLLQVYVPVARDAGIPDHVTLGYRLLSRLAFARGDVDEAFHALGELEALGYQRRCARVVASARLERSRIQLLQGHVEASRDELERGSDPAVWAPLQHLSLLASELEYPRLCRLRWQACANDPAEAAQALSRDIAEAMSARRHLRALKLRVLRAGALARGGERARALQEFREVARQCSREGFVRIVADESPLVGPLLRLLAEDDAPAVDGSPLATWLARLQRAMGEGGRLEDLPSVHKAAGPARPGGDAGAPIGMAPDLYRRDPLTPKELRVLQLLAEGYSNAAMADKLFVSDSTVRTHLRNINSKLAVSSRAQAVVAARRLGLLH